MVQDETGIDRRHSFIDCLGNPYIYIHACLLALDYGSFGSSKDRRLALGYTYRIR
jgi:hypothetical protein